MIQVYSIAGEPVALPLNLDPSSINAGAFNTQLISGFDRDLFKPVYLPNEINRHPRQKKFFFDDLLKYLGYQIPVSAGADGQYGHFEKERNAEMVIVDEDGFQGAGGNGDPVTFKLDVANIYTDPVTLAIFSVVRKRQVIHFQFDNTTIVNARITNVVTSGATKQVTMVPDDASVDLLALLGEADAGAGMELSLITNAYAEGSAQGTGLQHRNIRYQNNLQIVKEDDIRTGSAMTRAYQIKDVPFTYDGQEMVAYELVGAEEAKERFRYKKDGAILVGTISDNWTEDEVGQIEPGLEGMQVRSTQGLLTFANQNGNQIPYTLATYTINDIDSANDILDAESAPINYVWAYGSPFGQKIREVLKNYVDNDYIAKYVSGEIFGAVDEATASGLAVSVGFQSVKLMPSPRAFHFKNINSFDDPKMLGSSSYTYRDMFYLLPIGTFKNQMPAAQRTAMFGEFYNAAEMQYFGYCYSSKNGYNREVEMWDTGAAGGEAKMTKYTDTFDVKRLHFRGEFGAWAAAGNLYGVGFPA